MISFYKKYRLNNFDMVIGLEDIVCKLKEDIFKRDIDKCYLFAEERGAEKKSHC